MSKVTTKRERSKYIREEEKGKEGERKREEDT